MKDDQIFIFIIFVVSSKGYSISAYLILALTLGNLCPLLVNSNQSIVHEIKAINSPWITRAISFILITGLAAGILLASTFNIPVTIGENQYSIFLYLSFFIIGSCSSSSNVTHYIFVSSRTHKHTTALSVGMALGSTIAGVSGILQGFVLQYEGVSLCYYYIFISLLYVPAIFALYALSRRADTGGVSRALLSENSAFMTAHFTNTTRSDDDDDIDSNDGNNTNSNNSNSNNNTQAIVAIASPVRQLFWLQTMNSSFGYGVVPAIVSSVCSRFRAPSTVLLLATGISCTLDPMFRAYTLWNPITTHTRVKQFSFALFTLATVMFVLLVIPSNSSILESKVGGILPVVLYVSFNLIFGYTNTSLFLLMKSSFTQPEEVQNAYRLTGIHSQAGALLGSVVSFVLIVSGCLG